MIFQWVTGQPLGLRVYVHGRIFRRSFVWPLVLFLLVAPWTLPFVESLLEYAQNTLAIRDVPVALSGSLGRASYPARLGGLGRAGRGPIAPLAFGAGTKPPGVAALYYSAVVDFLGLV